MKNKSPQTRVSSPVASSAAQIEVQLKEAMAKVSWGKDEKIIVVESGALVLNPQIRARLMKPVTGEVPTMGLQIRKEIWWLKQKADQGDEIAAQILYEVATFGILALDSLHNLEQVKSVAKNKSIWPVMSSDDDSMIRKNIEVFERIQLASKMETRRISSLLKNETSELLWAVAIKTEIERIRDFIGALAPETMAELFGKANPVWPCSIIHQNILLKAETILACEKLPTLTEDDESKKAWWELLEIIFEIATDGKWEEIEELKSTYKSTAENTGTPAYERNYIRSSIKKNLKHKFLTRLAPDAK